jgi:hypothetical protein
VICPHCSADLNRKQRYRRKCSKCRETFALEPKENDLRLHDLKVRKLATVLADPLRKGAAPLPYTADQLRLAASRKILVEGPESGRLSNAGVAAAIGVVPTIMAVAFDAPWFFTIIVFGIWAGVVFNLIGHFSTAHERRYPGEPMSAWAFAALLTCWQEVYGKPPPGLLPSGPVKDVWPPTPPVALLYCTDAGVVKFLATCGIAERRGVALINQGPALQSAVRAHPTLPVYVLHHADPVGCMAVTRLRAVLPPGTRVIDAGLRPRVAARAGPPVRIRPDPEVLDELARTGAVDADEQDWLAEGNTLPLAAVRPARLLMAVERAVTQVDPEERRAAAVGFMAWPERAG